MDYEIDEDEVILYKGDVKYAIDEKKIDTKFTLTSKKLVFETKKKELLNSVQLDEIKVFNDKVQCRQNFTELQIQSVKNDFSIYFGNIFDATKVWNLIIDNITGTNIVKRGLKKAKDSLEVVDEVLDIADDAKGKVRKGLIGRKK